MVGLSRDGRRVPGQPQRLYLVPLVNIVQIDIPAGGRVSAGRERREGWGDKNWERRLH